MHLSGCFLAKSSCARANLGHENGVIFPNTLKLERKLETFAVTCDPTFGLVISKEMVDDGCAFSIVIELLVWIGNVVSSSLVGIDEVCF